MKNRATYIMIITLAMIVTAISVGGCFTSCNTEPTYELVPTTTTTTEATTTTTVETTVETTETTVEPTESTETVETIENSTLESTAESNYKNNDIDFGNDKNAAETHKENKGGKVTTTKAPSKKPAISTKKPEPTKKPAATKAPTNTPKPTEKPKPTATPVPSKGYAIIKVKVTSNVYVDDESDETEKKVDYFEIKAYTKKYHSKTPSDYHYDGDIIANKIEKKYGNNIQNYSAKNVEVVKFTN